MVGCQLGPSRCVIMSFFLVYGQRHIGTLVTTSVLSDGKGRSRPTCLQSDQFAVSTHPRTDLASLETFKNRFTHK